MSVWSCWKSSYVIPVQHYANGNSGGLIIIRVAIRLMRYVIRRNTKKHTGRPIRRLSKKNSKNMTKPIANVKANSEEFAELKLN